MSQSLNHSHNVQTVDGPGIFRASLEELLAQPPNFLDRLTLPEQKQLLQLLAKVFETERRRPR